MPRADDPPENRKITRWAACYPMSALTYRSLAVRLRKCTCSSAPRTISALDGSRFQSRSACLLESRRPGISENSDRTTRIRSDTFFAGCTLIDIGPRQLSGQSACQRNEGRYARMQRPPAIAVGTISRSVRNNPPAPPALPPLPRIPVDCREPAILARLAEVIRRIAVRDERRISDPLDPAKRAEELPARRITGCQQPLGDA